MHKSKPRLFFQFYIIITQGHVQGHDLGTRSRRVPESCSWIVSLNFLARLCWLRDTFRDTIQGHDTIPGTRHDSCPWKSLEFQTRFVSLRDTIKGHDRDTIRGMIVSLGRVPSSSSSIEGNPQLGLDYPVEDPPPVCTWHRKEQSIVFFSYRHRSLPT